MKTHRQSKVSVCLNVWTLLLSISLFLGALSCKGVYLSEEDPDSGSRLQAAHDGNHSIFLKQVEGEESFQFVTCNGAEENLDVSSCTPSLLLPNGEEHKYTVLPKDRLTSDHLLSITMMKEQFVKEYAEDGDDVEVMVMGGLASGAVVLGATAMQIHFDTGNVLEAKRLYETILETNPNTFSEVDKAALKAKFYTFENKIASQFKKKFKVLLEKILDLNKRGKSAEGHLMIMKDLLRHTQEFPAVRDLQIDGKSPSAVYSDLTFIVKHGNRQKFSQKMYLVDDVREALKKSQKAKALAKSGEYTKAFDLWMETDGFLLNEKSKIGFERDLKPYRTSPLRLEKLNKIWTAQVAKIEGLIAGGKQAYVEMTELNELLQNEYFDFKAEYSEKRQAFVALESKVKGKALYTKPGAVKAKALPVAKTAKTAVPLKPATPAKTAKTAVPLKPATPAKVSVVSKAGKVASSKPGWISGRAMSYLGIGTAILGGIGLIFGIVKKADSKTFADLAGVSSSSSTAGGVIDLMSENQVGFLPASVFGDYWPSLVDLDPSASLEVPSVLTVLKTLSLHASFGDVELAQGMKLCFPSASRSQPECKRTSEW